MKKVVAIIRSERLACLKRALKTVSIERIHVRGRSPHPDIRVYSSPRIRVEVVTKDTDADEVVDTIRQAAIRSAAPIAGDCRIFVETLDERWDLSA